MRVDLTNRHDVASCAAMILRTHPHMVICTSNSDKPWGVPVHQITDSIGMISWRSRLAARHSLNIQANSAVSGVLFSATHENGEVSLFVEGTAHPLDNEADLAPYLKLWSDPPSQDYLGAGLYRIYTLTMTSAWINDDSHEKTLVDTELLIELLQEGEK